MTQLLIVFIVIAALGLYARSSMRRITIYEYERGLRYRGGKFETLLGPGQYWIWAPSSTVMKVDIRPRIAAVPGQEVLTADGIAVKVSLAAEYRVLEPIVAINNHASYETALYTELQLAIRRVISAETIDSLFQKRPQLGAQLGEIVMPETGKLGLELIRVDLKDLTLPGELKKLFTQVTKARQEGLAALERARGETAALRSLANAARLVSDNPALLQLRLLQVVGEQSGNTVVMGIPSSSTPLPISATAKGRIEPPTSDSPDA